MNAAWEFISIPLTLTDEPMLLLEENGKPERACLDIFIEENPELFALPLGEILDRLDKFTKIC